MGCIKMKQKPVWILVGAPGSGKSTWASNYIRNHEGVIVSRDQVRFAMLEDGDDYFANEKQVYKEFIHWAQDKINDSCDGPVIIDATHLNQNSREKLIKSLDLTNVSEIHYFIFNIPFKICWERNCQRTGRAFVPKSAIRRMCLSMTDPMSDEDLNIHIPIFYTYFNPGEGE